MKRIASRRLARRGSLACIVAAATTTAGLSAAQTTGFAVDRFEPVSAGDPFFATPSPTVPIDTSFRATIVADYAHAPLVLRVRDGGEVGAVVSDQLYFHAGASLAFLGRFLVGLDIPIAAVDSGDSPTSGATTVRSPSSATLGDPRVDLRARLFGANSDLFQLAIGARVWVPLGSRDGYASDGSFRGGPSLIAGGRAEHFLWSASLGATFRASHSFGGDDFTHELGFTAGAALLAMDDRLQVGPEIYGTTGTSSLFSRTSTGAEVLLGAKYRWNPIIVGVAAGPGIGVGVGTPEVRMLASITYAPADAAPIVAAPPLAAAPLPAPAPPAAPLPDRGDHDSDGILDVDDACPMVAGVFSPDPKRNGCPADRDGDGVLDPVDACPDLPGIPNIDPAKNGCPIVRITDREIVVLEKVHFEFAKARIMPDSDTLLGLIAQALLEHPEVKRIEVQGYTDDLGSADFNMTLSQERAEAVVERLVTHGVARGRLVARGFGVTHPVTSNATDAGREQNRRVEFIILEKGDAAPR